MSERHSRKTAELVRQGLGQGFRIKRPSPDTLQGLAAERLAHHALALRTDLNAPYPGGKVSLISDIIDAVRPILCEPEAADRAA